MKIKRNINRAFDRKIMVAMISSTRFVREILPIYDSSYVSEMGKLVCDWCISYYKEYNTAPGRHIDDILDYHKRQGLPDEMHSAIDSLLEEEIEEIERGDSINVDYLVDQTELHFKRISLRDLGVDLKNGAINAESHDQVREVESRLSDFKKVQRLLGEGLTLNEIEPEKVQSIFSVAQKPLFELPGAIGQLINSDLLRGSFVGFMGKEKIGKTWLLMELAFRALSARQNVAFFQAGDMSEDSQLKRILIRLARRSDRQKYCGDVMIPTLDCMHNQLDTCDKKERMCDIGLMLDGRRWSQNTYKIIAEIQGNINRPWTPLGKMIVENMKDGYKPCSVCRRTDKYAYAGRVWFEKKKITPLVWKEAYKQLEKFKNRWGKHRFKLSSHPSDSLNVEQIRRILDIWETSEGFVPDVVVTDYADIMAPEPKSSTEERHRQNTTWKAMRSLALERSCLVITATQADANSYSKGSLDLSNFSEDKRKYGHVTSMWAMNQKVWEKRWGIMRVAPLVAREDDFDLGLNATIIRSIQTGRPLIASFF